MIKTFNNMKNKENREIELKLALDDNNNGDIAMLLRNIADAQLKVLSLQDKIANLSEEKNNLEIRIKECQDYEGIKSQLRQNQNEIEQYKTTIIGLESEKSKLEGQIEELQKTKGKAEQDKNKCEQRITELEIKIGGLAATLNGYEGKTPIDKDVFYQIKEKMAKYDTMFEENINLKKEIKIKNEEITTKERKIQELTPFEKSFNELRNNQNEVIHKVLKRLTEGLNNVVIDPSNSELFNYISGILSGVEDVNNNSDTSFDWYKWIKEPDKPMVRFANLIWWHEQSCLEKIIEECCPDIKRIEELYIHILLPLFEIMCGIKIYMPDGVFTNEIEQYKLRHEYNDESYFCKFFKSYISNDEKVDKVYCEIYSLACSSPNGGQDQGNMFRNKVMLNQVVSDVYDVQ